MLVLNGADMNSHEQRSFYRTSLLHAMAEQEGSCVHVKI